MRTRSADNLGSDQGNAAQAQRAVDRGLPGHNNFQILQTALSLGAAAIEFLLDRFGFFGAKTKRRLPPLAGFGVGAADQIFAAFDLCPDHGTAIGVGAFVRFPVRSIALLGIDELASLVAVNS
jgi:hypothetical protein